MFFGRGAMVDEACRLNGIRGLACPVMLRVCMRWGGGGGGGGGGEGGVEEEVVVDEVEGEDC